MSWAPCNKKPETTQPQLPPCSGPWHYSVTSAIDSARPHFCATRAPYSGLPATTPRPLSASTRLSSGDAQTLTCLGDLTSQTAGSQQARCHYARALAIARDIGAPLEEASAL